MYEIIIRITQLLEDGEIINIADFCKENNISISRPTISKINTILKKFYESHQAGRKLFFASRLDKTTVGGLQNGS